MLRAVLAVLIASLPFAAQSQSYRCVGKDGKKYYGQAVPPQCLGQPVEELNTQGLVIKRFDAAASADERAKKEADDAERKKREALAKEQGRKDNALMASYTSEADIDVARSRALEGDQRAAKDAQARIAALRQRRGAPGADTGGIDADIKAQEGLLAAKTREMNAINARYDEDKKRFIEISKRGK